MIGRQSAATALTTVLLAFLMLQGVKAPLPLVILCAAAFCYVVVSCGLSIQRLLGAADLPLAAVWPLGVMPTGVGLWGLVALFGINAAAAFAIWAVLVIALDLWTRRNTAPQAALQRSDIIGLALCCAFTAAWCREVASAPMVLESTGTFQAWKEYFLHAGVMSMFGDPRAIGHGWIWLSDMPRVAYHYASYLPASAFALPLDQPGLPLATSVWLPIGYLCAVTASYTLGASIAGAAGGLAGLIAVFVIPDASNYWFRNGFFSFHWSLMANPGSTYGLGCALLAVTFQHRWQKERDRLSLTASVALLVMTPLVRMHIFLLLAPAWLATQLYVLREHRHFRRILFSAFIIVGGGFFLLTQLPPDLVRPISWIFAGGRALDRFLFQVHQLQEPNAYPGLYEYLVSEFGVAIAQTIGTLLIYPICLGAFLLALPAVTYLLHRRGTRSPSVAFPIAALLSYGAILILAPMSAHNDATDLTQRPFGLLYAVVAIWTLGMAVLWLSASAKHGTRLWQMIAVATVLVLPATWLSAHDMTRPKPDWATPWVNFRVPPELAEVAGFLRTHGKPGELFAAPTRETSVTAIDTPAVVTALTGMPTYLGRFGVHEMLSGAYRDVAYKRRGELLAIEAAKDQQDAKSALKRLGIRWYLVSQAGFPAWDLRRENAALKLGSFALYDFATGPTPQ